MLYLFLANAMTAIPYTEQMLFDNSDYVVYAEVVSSECLSHSENSEGYQDIRYLATLSIITIHKGEIEGSTIELYSHDFISPSHIPPESCSWYYTAHPVGEIGTYYRQENGSVNTLHTYGFAPAPMSNPSEVTPLDSEEPSSEPSIGEPSHESNEEIIEEEISNEPAQDDFSLSDFDTGLSNTNDASLTDANGGGCNHNAPKPLSFVLISLFMILIRKKNKILYSPSYFNPVPVKERDFNVILQTEDIIFSLKNDFHEQTQNFYTIMMKKGHMP